MENNKIVGMGDYKNYYAIAFQVLGAVDGYSCVGCLSCVSGYTLNN